MRARYLGSPEGASGTAEEEQKRQEKNPTSEPRRSRSEGVSAWTAKLPGVVRRIFTDKRSEKEGAAMKTQIG